MKFWPALVFLVGCDKVLGLDDPQAQQPRYVAIKDQALGNGSSRPEMTVAMDNVVAGDVLLVEVCSLSGTTPTGVDDGANSYTSLAPVTSGNLESDLFVASVSADAATLEVVVHFAPAATNPDIHVVEYRGVDLPTSAVTTMAAAAGSLDTTITVDAAPAIVVAGNCVGSYTLDIPNFTLRDQTIINGDRIADMYVTDAGDYVATTNAQGEMTIINTVVALVGN